MASIYADRTELNAITNDYFNLDGGKAWDNYFNTSYAMHYFLKEKKGLYEEVPGGADFKVPVEYDRVGGGAYERGTTALARVNGTKSYANQIIQNATFYPVHYFSSAKVLRVDELQNAGGYELVKMVTARVANAQKTIARELATDFHSTTNDTSQDTKIWSTLECCLNANPGRAGNYGNIAYNAFDSWAGRRNTTAAPISLDVIRTDRNTAKVRDGKNGKPDICFTTVSLFAVIQDIVAAMQAFVTEKDSASVGFTTIKQEGLTIIEDDYVPSGYMILINSPYYGVNIVKGGNFQKTPWMIETATASDKFMDIYWDGQIVCGHRNAHIAHSGLTTA